MTHNNLFSFEGAESQSSEALFIIWQTLGGIPPQRGRKVKYLSSQAAKSMHLVEALLGDIEKNMPLVVDLWDHQPRGIQFLLDRDDVIAILEVLATFGS